MVDLVHTVMLQRVVQELESKVQCLGNTLTLIYSQNKILNNACTELIELEASGASIEDIKKEITYLKELKDMLKR